MDTHRLCSPCMQMALAGKFSINLNQYVFIKTGSCSPPPSRTYSHVQACGPSELQSWDWCAGSGGPLSFSLGERPGGSLDEGRQVSTCGWNAVPTCWSSPLLCLGNCQPKAGSSSLLPRGWGHLSYVLQWMRSLLPKMHVHCAHGDPGASVLVERPAGKSLIFHGPPHPVFPSKASLDLRD